jgi:hypothetical protein
MKKLLLIAFVLFTGILSAQTTYTWNQTGTNDYQVAANWTPARTTPASNDVLVFNNGASVSITVTNVPQQTIGQLLVTANTFITLQAAVTDTLSISGGAGTDLSVAAGAQLNISSAIGMSIKLLAATTGSVSGSMTLSGGNHRVLVNDANGLQFNSGSVFTAGTGFAGNAFGLTGTAGSVQFVSGSKYVAIAGSNPFGPSGVAAVAVFQTGSLFSLQGAITPSFSGRTYANVEINVSAANVTTVTGGSAVVMDNLSIIQGTLNFNMTGTPGHSIKGNITVAAGATLAFGPASAGTLNLNGTALQTISNSGTMTFSALQNMVINNAAGISCTAPITFNGAFTLTSGIFDMGSNTLTFGSAAVVSPGSLTSYINGKVAYTVAAATGSINFPLGKGGKFRRVTLTVNHTDATAYTYTAELINSAPPANDTTGVGVRRIQTQRYFTITRSSGNTGLTGATISIYMRNGGADDDAYNFAAANFLRIVKDNGAGAWVNLGGTFSGDIDSGTVTSNTNAVTSFSNFTSADAYGGSSALPVELSSFSSAVTGRNAALSWVTATERNNRSFEIERKLSGSGNWQKAGEIAGHNNTSTPVSYSFTDTKLDAGKYNYRLKQVDYNGNFEYFALTNEVEIGLPGKFTLSQNYPNPFNPATKIDFEMPVDGKVTMKLYDMTGKIAAVLIAGEQRAAGYYTVQLNGSALATGAYFYKLNIEGSKGFEMTKKMLLVK